MLNDNLDCIKGFASIEITVPLGAEEASGSEYRPILQPKSINLNLSQSLPKESLCRSDYIQDLIKCRTQLHYFLHGF